MERNLFGLIYTEEVYNLDSKTEKKDLVIVVDDNYSNQKELLSNILNSIGRTEQNTTIIKSNKPVNPDELEFRNLVTFGVELKDNKAEPFTASKEQGHTIIFAESLSEIEADSSKEKKKKLWNLLKKYLT